MIPYVTTLCGKLINYEIGTSIAWMVIWLALSIGSIVAAKKFYPTFKNGIENQGTYEIGWSVASFLAVVGIVFINFITICVVGQQIMDIIKCATFPEMYVFEYVQIIINAG